MILQSSLQNCITREDAIENVVDLAQLASGMS
jgi:hypothetical protein